MSPKNYPEFGLLLVDDEPAFLRSLGILLERSAGITNLERCEDSRQVMERLGRGGIGLVLLDLTMPHLSGEKLLEMIRADYPEIEVIVISGMNQVETAVSCVKNGAFDYFVKTAEENRLIQGVQRAINVIELQNENRRLRERFLGDTLERPEAFSAIITADKTMRSVFQYIESIATSRQPILITGESGVGKELIARSAHSLSGVRGSLISINVAGLDDNTFADTLFGHTRGSFTGADQVRPGMIEEAAHGTLFLDEIGDLPTVSQVKLLRLLQENEYYPIGSDQHKRMTARVVVSTNRALTEMTASGQFRKDLFFRLRTHHVHVPPLRERKNDIPLLLSHFLQSVAEDLGKQTPVVPKELSILLSNYSFPGNVRELKAMVYDAISAHKSKMLSMETFKRTIERTHGSVLRPLHISSTAQSIFNASAPLPSLNAIVDLLVDEAMSRAQGNQSIASRLIGISQPALSKRLNKKTSAPPDPL